MQTLVLATRNKDKIEEMRSALEPFDITLKSTYDFPDLEEVVEDRDTLEGNALKKARYVFQQTGLPSLADDTGLEVAALGGRPGVYSARYAGEKATYQQNVDKLLEELKEVPPAKRKAQFRTVIALLTGDEPKTFEGICRGEITAEERGDGGFGYDPVFRPLDCEQTFAELSLQVKNEISHRGKAIAGFVRWLRQKD